MLVANTHTRTRTHTRHANTLVWRGRQWHRIAVINPQDAARKLAQAANSQAAAALVQAALRKHSNDTQANATLDLRYKVRRVVQLLACAL